MTPGEDSAWRRRRNDFDVQRSQTVSPQTRKETKRRLRRSRWRRWSLILEATVFSLAPKLFYMIPEVRFFLSRWSGHFFPVTSHKSQIRRLVAEWPRCEVNKLLHGVVGGGQFENCIKFNSNFSGGYIPGLKLLHKWPLSSHRWIFK